MDLIQFRYRGTMRDWNGVLFQVDWASCPEQNCVFPGETPFRSGIWGEFGPYDLGWIGEIPRFRQAKSNAVLPARVCTCCFIGLDSWWTTGYPLSAPPVTLASDKWPVDCIPHIDFYSCESECTSVQEFIPPHYGALVCFEDCVNATFHTGSTQSVTACHCGASYFSSAASPSFQVAACEATCTHTGYSNGAKYTVDSCHDVCASVLSRIGGEQSVSSCFASCAAFVEGIPVPLTSFHCTTVVAAGNSQGTATPITDDNTYVTGADGTKGVILPDGCYRLAIFNPFGSGFVLRVWPPVGGNISHQGVDQRDTILANHGRLYVRFDNNEWYATDLN